VNLLQEKLFEWFFKSKRKISIKIISYVCCMQRMQHIFNKCDKKEKLLSKECKLETLQNQTLHHVTEVFKRVSIETLKTEMYTSLLHVHLNMLQDNITLCSQVNDWTQKIKQACKLIRVHLTKVNHIISHLFIIKKIILLNVFIQEDVKIQLRCKWCIFFFTMTSTSDNIAIAQYHKDQWNKWWEKYKECIIDINAISAQRSHLSNKMIKMHDDF